MIIASVIKEMRVGQTARALLEWGANESTGVTPR